MNKLLLLILITTITIHSQTIYEVQPGTKGNKINLTIANISEINVAEGVSISPTKPPLRGGLKRNAININQEEQTIERIEPGEEKQVTFTFDIDRNAPVNRKDTVEFMITDKNGMSMMKTFIFNYTAPKEFRLEQNYPNPFNPSTTIQYQLPANAKVTLKVYDILGSEVATLIDKEQEAGYKEVQFNAYSYASGMYIYRLTAGRFSSVKKMLLVK